MITKLCEESSLLDEIERKLTSLYQSDSGFYGVRLTRDAEPRSICFAYL